LFTKFLKYSTYFQIFSEEPWSMFWISQSFSSGIFQFKSMSIFSKFKGSPAVLKYQEMFIQYLTIFWNIFKIFSKSWTPFLLFKKILKYIQIYDKNATYLKKSKKICTLNSLIILWNNSRYSQAFQIGWKYLQTS